jgi:hypothetical protein
MIYAFPEESTAPQRRTYCAQALLHCGSDTPIAIIEAIGNLAHCLVPDCHGPMFDCRWDVENVNPHTFRIYGQQVDAGGLPLTPATFVAEANALPSDQQWGQATLGQVSIRDATALFALVGFCVVKAPTAMNATAFTQSRPLAAAKGAGLDQFPVHLLPTLDTLRCVNNALQSDRRARIPFAHCLVSWATSREVNAQQSGMASQASLWRDQGFGGLKLARKLILAYGPALQRVPRLSAQLPAFQEHWDAYSANASPYRAYFGAIYGPTNPLSARDDYSLLALLSRDIDAAAFAVGRGMRNFGAGRAVPDDVKQAFMTACADLNLPLPRL